VYFVATGALATGAVSGEDNLYLLHESSGVWSVRYITTLSGEDENSWYGGDAKQPDLADVSSRVSPDGRYLAFMSERSLTGYDNRDAVNGEPDEEVYLYDAVADRLVCASCNPTGARPVGVLDKELLADSGGVWGTDDSGKVGNGYHWLAGNIQGWQEGGEGSDRQSRYLSDSGRLFFDSPEALVPQDTNGLEDVYEYEPVGVGGVNGCSEASLTFSQRSVGCVDLVSSGTSASESVFVDASETGDDVFFLTASKLVPEDYDNAYDVYDAHVCSVAAPCVTVPVSSPPCTSGDSCKAAPSPQPEIFGPAPSATFSGVGNVVSSSSSGAVAPKSLTRAQKLARALRACRKKGRNKRVVCERRARGRYGLRRSQKSRAKATNKGNG
jgi:dipeptidyl aminopeptidase/acylaminoacyl peptidase